MVEFRQNGDLTYCRFPVMDKLHMVDCAFSTRLGGVSRGSYAELNLSLHVEDELIGSLKTAGSKVLT